MRRMAPWWNSFPFIRILIPLVAGILLHPKRLWIPAILMILTLSPAFIMKFLSIYRQFKLRFLQGLWINACWFFCGCFVSFSHDLRNDNRWFAAHEYDALILRTIAEPKSNSSGLIINTNVLQFRRNNQWVNCSGKLGVRIRGHPKEIYSGSLVYISQKPQPITEKGNSNFSLKSYLANQNIYHQASLDSTDYYIIERAPPPRNLVAALRKNILSAMDRYFPGKAEKALAKALLVGYRDELEKTTIQAYTDTGVIHVIAISGLHLGLIYGLLILVFKPFSQTRRTKLIVNTVIATLLWIFTLICGASPSVVRSAVMFSSLLAGEVLGSENNTGNALASSAFLLLCYDPNLLNDVGFQLSYAAVASLLIYNTGISSLYKPENGIISNFWTGVSTSISAQILTTPLVLVHFHQFPLLFILSNLVAVPVSSLILLLLILLCLIQSLGPIADLLAEVCAWLIRFMNNQVERISFVPFSAWKEISWTYADLVFSYLAILFLSIFLKTKNKPTLIHFLLIMLTWIIIRKYFS